MSETLWVYVKSESNLWTVGFYDPQGKWHPESDHAYQFKTVRRVHYLNGGETESHPDELLRDAMIQFLDNRPDDEQGTEEERKKFARYARRLGELLGVSIDRWGYGD